MWKKLLALVGIISALAHPTWEAMAVPARPRPARAAEAPIRNWGIFNRHSPSHVNARAAWKITKGKRNVVVAVIDTGIDVRHPGLKKSLWKKRGGAEYGYDFVLNRPNPTDTNGHGTHVAGIIAANAVAAGALGVAPNVSLMAVRYTDGGTASIANMVKAIDYAVDNGADIINVSSEGKGFNAAEFRAIQRAEKKGILFIAAAGNSGEDNDSANEPTYPGAYELSNIITVAGTNQQNQLVASSSWGRRHVHVAAPGENIFSTLHNGRYGYLTGTSQAAAFVSGVAALMLSVNPNLKPHEVRRLIMDSADRLPGLASRLGSGGRVNALAALRLARGARPPVRMAAKSPSRPVLKARPAPRLVQK